MRLWPAESKEWGQAFAVELAEIEGFSASVWWLIGGAMLLTREHIRSFWKSLGRPFGAGTEDEAATEIARSRFWRSPRTPRWVTLLLLLGAAAMLLRGEMQTGIAMVTASATDEAWTPARWRSVQELHRKAAEAGDAKLLALLSLLADREPERAWLANQAIAKDASLTWLAYEFPRGGKEADAAVIERAKRVQKWDPENSAPRLLAAEPLFDRIASSSTDASLDSLNHANLSGLEKVAAANGEWMAAMDWAFSAPTYDAYGAQRLELVRQVAAKYGINDPDITARILAGEMLPNFMNVRTYARVLLHRDVARGSEAAATGDAWKVLHFTQQMQLHGRTLLEDVIAAAVATEACERLQPLLEKAGRGEEAALVGFERDRWRVEMERLTSRNLRAGDRVGSLVWAGVVMHGAVAAISISGIVSLLSCVFLAFRRDGTRGWFGGFCSAAVDWAPVLLVVACLALFVAYHPYARAYQTYFQAKAPVMDAESMESLVGAAAVASFLPEGWSPGFVGPRIVYAEWMAATIGLAMVAGILILRGWKRRVV
jgi:hypothetical protein